MTAVISCTSNTMLDRNRPSIGGDRWFGIFVSTALANDQSTSTVNLHILMSPLINICPFWEYRHSKWQHWSFVHRILCLIKIGFKLLVGERRFGILVATALMISPQASENFTHPDASIDQYIVVLRISTLFMTILISCTSKTLLDRNRS